MTAATPIGADFRKHLASEHLHLIFVPFYDVPVFVPYDVPVFVPAKNFFDTGSKKARRTIPRVEGATVDERDDYAAPTQDRTQLRLFVHPVD